MTIITYNHVFWLKISMDDLQFMTIADAVEDLFHNFDGLTLTETVLLDNSVKELASLAILSDNVKSFFCLSKLENLDNVRMCLGKSV